MRGIATPDTTKIMYNSKGLILSKSCSAVGETHIAYREC